MEARRFAVLLNRNRCAYSYALADALEAAAAHRNVDLEYWPVAWAQSAVEIEDAEVEELLARGKDLDGLVIIASVFSHGLKSLGKVAQGWWPKPAASVGFRLPLVPSVLVDNRGAMQAATRHLLQEHGRHDILFLRGRSDSQEASDRYFGFRQALSESHIINDSSRVLQGDFTKASAVNAISSLPPSLRFDALVASNDEMALAAITELERRGLRVPEDVAVIGFDDVPAAAKAQTPLSTMAQPFPALARRALELVIEQCEGQHVAATHSVPVTFVQRISCGCSGPRGRGTVAPTRLGK